MLVDGLDLKVGAGEFWAVLGRNGAGKTTLLHALAGVAPPAGGHVAIMGRDCGAHGMRELARLRSLLPQQESESFWGTVLEYVLLGRHPHDRGLLGWRDDDLDAAGRALAACDLAGLAQRRVATLSGGERQRARIAQALAQETALMLLDEPIQHLDLRHQAQAMDRLRAFADGGGAVVAVLHDLLWAMRACNRALLLFEGGGGLAGPVESVLTRENLERLHGCRFEEPGRAGFLPVPAARV